MFSRIPNHGGQNKGNRCRYPVNVAMLPHNEGILLKIGNVIERWTGIELEEQPAYVRMKQTFGDAVGVVIVIHVFVVVPMLVRP